MSDLQIFFKKFSFLLFSSKIINEWYNLRLLCSLDTKLVGPLLPSPAKPLPNDLEEFIMGSGDQGVILVSFGSIIGEEDDQMIATMATVFSGLQQRVIWKLNPGITE